MNTYMYAILLSHEGKNTMHQNPEILKDLAHQTVKDLEKWPRNGDVFQDPNFQV